MKRKQTRWPHGWPPGRVRKWAVTFSGELLLIVPTLFGILLVTFVLAQFAPGGPIEQIIARATIGADIHHLGHQRITATPA